MSIHQHHFRVCGQLCSGQLEGRLACLIALQGMTRALNVIACVVRRSVVQQMVKGLDRPALHAKTLGFRHPRTDQLLQFSSELPEDFVSALEQLRKLDSVK